MTSGPANQRLRPFKPQRFGRYTLLSPISSGGMGELFLGRIEGAHGFDKLCVIKKILPELAADPDFVARFVDEARILVKLSHGNIAQVLDMGVHEGAPYLALEFIDGKDLRRVLARMRDRRLPVPLSFVLTVMIRVLDALAYAHRKRGEDDRELNLVHRDISPQNVLVSYEGEVKVIDFGLAKSTLSSAKTQPSILLGKFRYMSPEQARHQKVDRRSDLYAVGLCLYELVTGHSPFEGVPPGELMARVANPVVRPLAEVEPLTPPALSDAVTRALQLDPAQRFQTAEEFRAKLQSLLAEIDPAAGPETTARFMRECFGVEFHAERRMLTMLKEQARQVDAAAGADAPPSSGAGPADTADSDDTAPEAAPASVEALSFQPTPKVAEGRPVSPAEQDTRPAATVPTEPRARLLKSRDEEPTEAAAPAVPPPAPEPAALPSIVIDGLPSAPVRTELEVPVSRPVPRPARDKEPSMSKRAPVKAARSAEPQVKEASERPRREKPVVKKEPPPSPPPTRPPAQTAVIPAAAAERPAPAGPRASGSSVWVWLVVPLLAVLSVGGYIGWDVYTEQLKAQRLREEQEAQQVPAPARSPAPAPREASEAAGELEPIAPVSAPSAGPGVAAPEAPKKVPVKPRAPAASPGAKALAALKADYGRLVDELVQKRFKLKLNALEADVAEQGDQAAFLARVTALHDAVKAELEKQQ